MNPRLQVFDLDGTLLRGTSSFRFFFYLISKRRLPLRSTVRAVAFFILFRMGRLSVSDLHHRVFDLFLKGKSKRMFVEVVEPFLDLVFIKMLNSTVVSKIHHSKSLLLSSSPDFLVGPIAQRLGIENWQASEYAVDKEGNFCKISSLIEGREKLRLTRCFAQRESISPAQIAAYSDSDDDLPLLEWVGFPYAVRPNRPLQRAAAKRGWKILL
ncbi:MAG: HAD-IB family phosphatase [Verrucomicrobia bacterium]|nr:HAD-IB family phosphatase [Verrucomicrobiota bacterium]